MYPLRRWWTRYGLQTALVGGAIVASWVLRQTNGALIAEVYQFIVQPFKGQPSQAEVIASARVLELKSRIAELEGQNQALKELIDYVETSRQQGVAAPVIGYASDPWWQQITIGRGSRHGIEPGYIVTGPGGLVGRVITVTPNTSRVLTIADPSNSVGVTVSRSRHLGYMRGKSSHSGMKAVMKFFERAPDVKPNDPITTSSVSEFYPPGIPVGRVESVDMNASPAPEAIIQISAPIHHLEWVVVSPGRSGSSAFKQTEND